MALIPLINKSVHYPLIEDKISSLNQQNQQRTRNMQDEKEINAILGNYWPWSTQAPKARGLRNLRLEGLFPNNDFIKAKRLVSPLRFGRPGGGAPICTNSGRKLIRTREDPLIRFQCHKDLRKCVDNNLRYKTNNAQQEQYRQFLEAQIAERKLREKWEKQDILSFYKQAGWSTEDTLKQLSTSQDYGQSILNEYEKFRKLVAQPAKDPKDYTFNPNLWRNEENLYDPVKFDFHPNKAKLSPLNKNKLNDEELVPLLAKQRAFPVKIPLGTTDVTRGNTELKKFTNPKYLQELTNQIEKSRKQTQEVKVNERNSINRHFQALDNFWGRPGNGAPLPILKKRCLEELLFNQNVFAH